MIFITFEGSEGSGKSTQAKMLYNSLIEQQKSSLITREPGGTDKAEKIRNFIMETADLLPITELLLHNAARYEHVSNLIKPALLEKKTVICDRFLDSTIAYQAMAMGVGLDKIIEMHKLCLDNFMPDITFIIDVPLEVGLERTKKRLDNNRYDLMTKNFHEKIREAFLHIAELYKDRCVLINGNKEILEVHNEILLNLKEKFNLC
jgi:dTMP kinase